MRFTLRHQCVKLIITVSVLVGLHTTLLQAQAGRARALVIGVRRYPRYAPTEPLKFSNQDAALFSDYLNRSKLGTFQKEDLIVITDE
jgi:hypothetical protein